MEELLAERNALVAELDAARQAKADAVAAARAAKLKITAFDEAHEEVLMIHCKAIARGRGTAKRLAAEKEAN